MDAPDWDSLIRKSESKARSASKFGFIWTVIYYSLGTTVVLSAGLSTLSNIGPVEYNRFISQRKLAVLASISAILYAFLQPHKKSYPHIAFSYRYEAIETTAKRFKQEGKGFNELAEVSSKIEKCDLEYAANAFLYSPPELIKEKN